MTSGTEQKGEGRPTTSAAPRFSRFDLTDRTAIVTGGAGILGGVMAAALAESGARVAILGRTASRAEARAAELRKGGADAMALCADVLDPGAIAAARDRMLQEWGRIDILVNAAGGNVARSRNDDAPVFDVPPEAFDEVLKLNLHGSVGPTLVFGESMAAAGRGCVLNVSSMAAHQALSGVMGYSVAKAAIDSFTRWLAADLARRYGDGMRVNAVAPGFFITEQNRAVMMTERGELTARAARVVGKTPMGRLGDPAELAGVTQWLCSDAASFVTGIVVPVDGGFSADTGI